MTVSVVVPLHNAEHYLLDTVRSIREQTVPPAEIIIVDDASTDGSHQLALDLADASDIPIVVLHNDTAQGVARARNQAVACARGDWVGFCDNDDLWHPQLLASALSLRSDFPDARALGVDSFGFALESDRAALAGHQRAAMVTHWVKGDYLLDNLVTAAGRIDASVRRMVGLADFQEQTVFATTQLIIRRDELFATGGFASWCHRADDWILNGSLAARGPLPVVNQNLVFYRVRASSQSHALAESFLPLLAATLALRFGGPTPDLRPSSAMYRHLVESYLRDGGDLWRGLGLALVGGGYTPRQLASLIKVARRRVATGSMTVQGRT